ncbi:hypothetical protein AAFC00_000368 [Neodothiora populina]|uniref:Mitochondrial nucleoid factor 1 n=1 Tax=Neodothiora populina TaxID=2781224 RepID=A0ABR3PCP3_9PEZI
MSRAQISKHYTRLFNRWPVDRLRPGISFQKVLKKRIAAGPEPDINESNTAQVEVVNPSRSTPTAELREVNALYSLLENRYANEYPLSQKMMNPTSVPDHYRDLEKELDEVPNRSWGQNFLKRLSGMVRWQ